MIERVLPTYHKFKMDAQDERKENQTDAQNEGKEN